MEDMMNTLKDCGKKVKEFVKENKDLILMVAGVIAAAATICVMIKLLCRKK